MVLNRYIPWLLAFVVLVTFQLAISYPRQVYWFIALSFLFLLSSFWQLTGHKLIDSKFWNFLITPFVFLASAWLFFIFLRGWWLKQLTIFVVVIFLWLFLKVVFLYLFFRHKYQTHSLGNISSYLNLINIFFLTVGFFSFRIFLGFVFWPLVPIIFFVSGLLLYQLFWSSQISFFSSYRYVLTVALVLSEIFLVVGFLPTSVYVSGLTVTIIYYLLSGLSRNWLLDIKERSVVTRYLTISSILLIIILVSAKWI